MTAFSPYSALSRERNLTLSPDTNVKTLFRRITLNIRNSDIYFNDRASSNTGDKSIGEWVNNSLAWYTY